MYNLPTHIAIIMDGNGRWAQKRGLPRNLGHKEGIKAVERTLDACIKFHIKFVTFYAFSTENWKRDKEEIDGIFSLLRDYLENNPDYFNKKDIKIKHIGELSPFPEDLKKELTKAENQTTNNETLTMTLALNYGGQDEITRAVNKLLKENKMEITYKDISQNLDTNFLPDPDLVIRTSGENRLSNFMMLQMAYSELYFPKVLWPDFNEKELKKALKIFSKRERRFGGLKK